jgi:DNA-binding Lrp family transcriptional regulator
LRHEPFVALASRLGIGSGEVIERIKRFKQEGVVRQIGPVLEARRLGYYTTLVAFKVAEENLDKATDVIRRHPGISHGYLRQHQFNVWITLSAVSSGAMWSELEKLAVSINAKAVVELPVVKLYKIGFYLDLEGSGQPTPYNTSTSYRRARLSPQDKVVINELQQDLPLVDYPFDIMSTNVGMSTRDFLARCRSLKRRGVMRRFGAAVNHRRAGYKANAMTCWEVPTQKADAVGARLAACKEVSHCYLRKTGPSWQYNIFAMIHGRTREECFRVADTLTVECNLGKYTALFSVKELKKVRVRYKL